MEGVSSKKTFSKYLFGFFLLLVVATISYLSITSAYGAEGILRQLSFYGSLKTAANTAVADGEYDVVFKIYDAPTGGNLLWTGTHTTANGNPITITNGFFNTLLGSGTGNTLSLDFSSDTYYLGITVGTDSEMTPRERIGASAYAFNADKVDGLDASSFVRANATTSIATSSADTLFTITQSGAGDILNIFDGSTEVFSILDGGYVGIGSSSPSAKLTIADGNLFVGGTITATSTGTSTFAGGINISSGCYAINSTCIAGSNSITSLGPVGQMQTGSTITLATSTTGVDFAITGAGDTLTFSLPSASSIARGLLSSSDWTTFNTKVSTSSIDLSAEIASLVTDETGSGALVFANNTSFTGTTNLVSLLASASSTIGGGTTQTGLTISGGATTTGNAYVLGNLFVGTTSTNARLSVTGTNSDTLLFLEGTSASLVGYTDTSGNGAGTFLLGTPGSKDLAFLTGNAERVRLTNTGFLGIGTSTPSAKLSVHTDVGDTATTLFAIGSSTASEVTTLFSVSNTGTTNLMSLFASASSTIGGGTADTGLTISGGATTTGNAYFAGNVGIGTNDPQEMLDVRGLITGGTGFDSHKNYIDLQNAGDGLAALTFGLDGGSVIKMMHATDLSVGNDNTALIQFQPLDSSEYGYIETWGGAGLILGTGDNGPIIFRPQRGEIARFTSTGLGIGTSTPNTMLHVSGAWADTNSHGNLQLSSTDYDTSVGLTLVQEDPGPAQRNWGITANWDRDGLLQIRHSTANTGTGNELAIMTFDASNSSSMVGINTYNPSANLSIQGTAEDTRDIFTIASSTGTKLLTVTANGNLGIGTTSPYAKLSIAGGDLFVGGTISATSTATSTFSGPLSAQAFNIDFADSRNHTLIYLNGVPLASASSTSHSTFFGINAGTSTTASTWESSDNTGIGAYALASAIPGNNSGTENTAVGAFALQNNISGYNNTAVGVAALQKVGSNDNTAVGLSAFENTTSGWGNSGLGNLAGYSNISGSQLTFLGAYTDTLVDGLTKAGAIGYGAKVGTSSALILGGTGSDAVRIGIGTTSPYARLSIHANNGDTVPTLFSIGSSTASATTTLFSVSNTGSTTVQNGINITAGCFAKNDICLDADFTTFGNKLATTSIDTSAKLAGIVTNETGDGALVFANNASLTGTTNLVSLLATASSTVGGGTAQTGLTINGGATTTGNAYFAGNVGMGSTSPAAKLSVVFSNTNRGLYVTGTTASVASDVKVIEASGSYEFNIVGRNLYGVFSAPVTTSAMFAQASNNYAFYAQPSGGLVDWGIYTTGEDKNYFSGNVGIGTTSPYAKLSVHARVGDTTTTLFTIGSSTASGTTTLFSVLNAGGVIVGNSASLTTTNIQGTNAIPQFQISASGAEASSLIQRYSANATPGRLLFLKTRGTSSTDFSSVSSGDQLGALSFAGSNGTEAAEGAQIRAYTTAANVGGNYTAAALGFWTSPGGSTLPTERLTIYSNGDIGVGTTSPEANLHISGSGSGSYTAEGYASLLTITAPDNSPFGILFQNTSYGSTSDAGIYNNGTGLRFGVSLPSGSLSSPLEVTNQGIQLSPHASSNNPLTFLSYTGTDYGTLSGRGTYFSLGWTADPAATSTPVLSWTTGDRVGIGTTSPTAQFTTTGSVRFANFAAGSLVTDANGNLSLSSDERLKNIEGNFTKGLAEILNIEPISYKWKPETGFDTEGIYTGFSAQNVQEFIPEAVGEDKRGFLSLSDRPLLAAVINAIKEMYATLTAHTSRIETLESEIDSLRNEVEQLRNREGAGSETPAPEDQPTVQENPPAPNPDVEPDQPEPAPEDPELLPETPPEPASEEAPETPPTIE